MEIPYQLENWNILYLSNVIKIIFFVHIQKEWVRHSVMKPGDSDSFQMRKYIKVGGKNKCDDFDTDILEKGL